MERFFLSVGLLAALATAAAAACSRRPVRSALASGILGAALLGLLDFAAAQTGIGVALNWGTALFSVAMGLPGVICLLTLRLLALA